MAMIAVVIKCPAVVNEATADYRLIFPIDSTIAELRHRLAKEHPCKPPQVEQRLIFGGRLLEDLESLKELVLSLENSRGQIENLDTSNNITFNEHQELVIHMVIRSGNYGKMSNLPSDATVPPLSSSKFPSSSLSTIEKEDEGKKDLSDKYEETRPSTSTVSPTERRSSSLRPAYYEIVNDHGQIVYADISNALIFDGRQFYVMRGASSNISQSLTPGGTEMFLSSSGGRSSTVNYMPITMNASIPTTSSRPTRTTSPSQSGRQEAAREQPRPHRRIIFQRLHIDLAAILTFLLRFAIVIIIFSQGGNKLRIAAISIFFGFVFLFQAGFFNFLEMSRLVRKLWDPIVRIRQPSLRPETEQERGEEREEEREEEGEERERRPSSSTVPQEGEGTNERLVPPAPHGVEAVSPTQIPRPSVQTGILYKFLEIITTFWLSLFPTAPPPELNNRAAIPDAAVH